MFIFRDFRNIGLRKVTNCRPNISSKIDPLERRLLNAYFPLFHHIGLRKVKNCGLNMSSKIDPLERRLVNVYFQ